MERTVQEISRTLGTPAGPSTGRVPGRRESPVGLFLQKLLLPLSWPYGWVVTARNRWYDTRSTLSGVPVISIGNLVVGGTGKTPLAVYLGRLLRSEGWCVSIVSRGYGRRGDTRDLRVVRTDGGEIPDKVDLLGDEPTMMARQLPGTPVVVCGDRVRAVRHARNEFGAEVVLLDDGFQHRKIHRDLDLLLIDSLNPFGNGHLLPAGSLREPLREIHRADAVLLTRWDLCPDGQKLIREVHRWTRPGTPLFRCRQRVLGLRKSPGGTRLGAGTLSGMRILAFSGIGNPRSFEQLMQRCGFQVVEFLRFSDHHPYVARDRRRILRAAARSEAEALLTTEKDLIRFPGEDLPLPLYALEVALEAIEEREFLDLVRNALPLPPSAGKNLAGSHG